MLNPAQRSHLLELLRPPPGYRLDVAIGTTFSLDLLSALIVPLSFAFFDWEHADGRPVADPLALLEALRQYELYLLEDRKLSPESINITPQKPLRCRGRARLATATSASVFRSVTA